MVPDSCEASTEKEQSTQFPELEIQFTPLLKSGSETPWLYYPSTS